MNRTAKERTRPALTDQGGENVASAARSRRGRYQAKAQARGATPLSKREIAMDLPASVIEARLAAWERWLAYQRRIAA